jgi:elongation factor Ts
MTVSFTAQDVKALRESTGAGMMDCKKALEETGGDIDAAKQLLREKGLAASAKRDDRENNQGVVALHVDGNVGSLVLLKSETDFVAGSEQFKAEAATLAELVAAKGADAVTARQAELEELKILLKEKIELGAVVQIAGADGNVLGHYEHIQGGRGVNGVLVEMAGASDELAHDVAVHIAFARPKYLSRDDVPADEVAAERKTLETITINEGKPEAAIPKIVEGRLNGFFKDVCLLEQPYAKDDKISISQLIGDAQVIRFAQVEIG